MGCNIVIDKSFLRGAKGDEISQLAGSHKLLMSESLLYECVKQFEVTSGFQGGIRDIKTIESYLAVCHNKSIEEVKKWVYQTCVIHAHEKARNELNTKAEMWELSDYELRFPPDSWLKNG